MLEESNPI